MEFSQRRYKSTRIIFQSSIIEWTEMLSLINRIDWHDGSISPYLRFPCDSGQSTFPLHPRLFVPQKKVSNLYYGRSCLGLRHNERKFIISFRFNPIHINIATWKKVYTEWQFRTWGWSSDTPHVYHPVVRLSFDCVWDFFFRFSGK